MKSKKHKFVTPITISSFIIAVIIGAFSFVFLNYHGNYTSFAKETKEWIRQTFMDIFTDEQAKIEKDNKNFNDAIKFKNNNSCKNIENSKTQKECFDSIEMLLAIDENNLQKCQNIETEHIATQCSQKIIKNKAIEKKLKQLCNAILDQNEQISCREAIDWNILRELISRWNITKQECENLENNFKKECLQEVDFFQEEADFNEILNSQNIALCSKLSDENLKKNCQEKILYNKAISEKNIVVCEYIADSETKNRCQENILSDIDAKILQNAVWKNNISDCNKLSGETLQNSCNDIIIFNFVKNSKNISLCKNLKNKENIEMCELLKN